jgi:hypothetical protein
MATPKSKKAPPASPLALLVDELGDLERELAPFKLKAARLEALRKSLRDSFRSQPSDGTFEVAGTRFLALVGPCSAQRLVNVTALFKLVGGMRFLKMAAVSLKALAENESTDVGLAVIETSDTGPRGLSVLAKAVAKAA